MGFEITSKCEQITYLNIFSGAKVVQSEIFSKITARNICNSFTPSQKRKYEKGTQPEVALRSEQESNTVPLALEIKNVLHSESNEYLV